MGVVQSFIQAYHSWRRRSFPPSIADAQWRHEEIVSRLTRIENLLVNPLIDDAADDPAAQQEVRSILRLLAPQKVVGFSKKRFGSLGDGGYVQIDDLAGVTHAFSFGVCDNDSWDLAMAQAGVPVEQFDHSVNGAPSKHPLLRFHQKMIAATASDQTATLADLVHEYSNASAPHLFLKTDIEGSEWDVFDQSPEDVIAKNTQIVCEFHDLLNLRASEFRSRAKRVFEKLHRHFVVTHVHANNCAPIGLVAQIALPDVIEISFANRQRYTFEPSDETFPTALDAPCSPSHLDYVLGAFRF